ncbi:alpha/beta hydrolase [Kribbella sp. NPDC051718]|uniref:alpha/beta fold hydrolase n=1 Tax=Kribbella sp. NPDC051718 TaxID=3155168 RepID=UPI00343EA8F3
MFTTRTLRRRALALVAGLTIAAGAGLATTASSASTNTTPKPTVVLVHGAFADSSSWNGVADRLQNDGYHVIGAANPLRSLPGDSAYISSVLRSVTGPIVLVGHSYGGSVITNAAAGNPNVKALVYVAAFAPDAGETATNILTTFPGSTLNPTLQPLPLADGSVDLTVRQDLFHQQFAADLPARDGRLAAVAQRPVSAAVFDQPTGTPAWKTIPSYFEIPTADKNIPLAAQRYMASRAHGTAITVQGASHAVLISQPGITTKLIERAAHETN